MSNSYKDHCRLKYGCMVCHKKYNEKLQNNMLKVSCRSQIKVKVKCYLYTDVELEMLT